MPGTLSLLRDALNCRETLFHHASTITMCPVSAGLVNKPRTNHNRVTYWQAPPTTYFSLVPRHHHLRGKMESGNEIEHTSAGRDPRACLAPPSDIAHVSLPLWQPSKHARSTGPAPFLIWNPPASKKPCAQAIKDYKVSLGKEKFLLANYKNSSDPSKKALVWSGVWQRNLR